MANSEDYLDELLNSVADTRHDMDQAYNRKEEQRRQQQQQRNRVGVDEDFLTASGLDSYSPAPTRHENLRQIFSEDDFLRSFEAELDAEDQDSFLLEFERELGGDTLASGHSQGTAGLIDSINQEIGQAKTEALRDMGYPIPPVEVVEDEPEEVQPESVPDAPAEAAFIPEAPTDEDPLSAGLDFQIDAEPSAKADGAPELGLPNLDDELPDLSFLGAEDEGYSEDGLVDEGMDLMDLLSGDVDLYVISSLLNSDESMSPLEEAEDLFEAQVSVLAQDMPDPLAEAEAAAKPKKSLSLKGGITSFKSWLLRSEDDNGNIIEPAPKADNASISQENQDILAEIDAEGTAAAGIGKMLKKVKGKKGKAKSPATDKPKKEKKEKKPKKEKPAKPKKPKKLDESPKVPAKVNAIFLVFGMSICLLVYLLQQLLGYSRIVSQAEDYYQQADYINAYESLAYLDVKDADLQLYQRSRLLADLQRRLEDYELFMELDEYALAMDSLLMGVDCFQDYYDTAVDLGIGAEFLEMGQQLVSSLHNQFGVDEEEAAEINRMSREKYSIRVNEILLNLGML